MRHADVRNPRLLFYGRLPRFPLSQLGNRQAAFLADRLATEPITIFYTSPMLRARQTARVLATRHPGAPIRRALPLIEVRTGWMGALPEELPPRINLYEPPHSSDDESIEDIWRRVSGFLRVAGRRHAGETICCVSHGDPVVIAHAGARRMPLTLESIRGHFYPKKCSVTRLTIADGKAIAIEYQDVIGELAPELVAPH